MAGRGFIIAAPSSGSGKTTITLGLLAALKAAGHDVRGAKAGPDYIDPRFHEAACGRESMNLDGWAMQPDNLRELASGDGLLVVEAAMGLFDGAADGSGSAADLAATLDLPVVLVVDAARQSQSIAALVQGFAGFRDDVQVAGVLLNRVGSARHEAMLREALDAISMPVLGAVHRDEALSLPSRHLGLVQAGEREDLQTFIEGASQRVGDAVDLEDFVALAAPLAASSGGPAFPPLGKRIAIARDEAFSFIYPHLLRLWRGQGAEIFFFSPLADEAVPNDADFIFLPGGYPELHAEKLSNAVRCFASLRDCAKRGVTIHGECGGYMALGETLIDAAGKTHDMAGLLPVTTSFAQRRLSLGYRRAVLKEPLGPLAAGTALRGHEFHYSTVVDEAEDGRLFDVQDALGAPLPMAGLRRGSVSGSYLHMIDIEPSNR